MPRSRAAAESMLSMPAPARATQRSLGAASIRRRVTLVAPRTTQASMSPTRPRRSSSERPLHSSTFRAGMPRSMATAAGESGSLTRTLTDTRRGARRGGAEGLLRRADGGARLHLAAVIQERRFEGADEPEDVSLVVVADVTQAEDLPLQAILAARDLHPVLGLHGLQHAASVHARRDRNGGEGVRGHLGEERQAQRPHRGPGGVPVSLVPREDLL